MAHQGRRDSKEQRQAAQWAMWRAAGVDKSIAAHDAFILTHGVFGHENDFHPENIIRLVDLAKAYVK